MKKETQLILSTVLITLTVVIILTAPLFVLLWKKSDALAVEKEEKTKMVSGTTGALQTPPTVVQMERRIPQEWVVQQDYTRRILQKDRDVLENPMQPPTNRIDLRGEAGTMQYTDRRMFNVPTSSKGDSYRLVGYLVNQDASETKDIGGNTWKLMAKEIRNGHSTFYIMPTNTHENVKIPITDNMVVGGQKIRDIYTIPEYIQFNSPLLKDSPYMFVELPKTDYRDFT
jgi:hypothetical protein